MKVIEENNCLLTGRLANKFVRNKQVFYKIIDMASFVCSAARVYTQQDLYKRKVLVILANRTTITND